MSKRLAKDGVFSRADLISLTGYSPESIARFIRLGVVEPLRTPSGRNVFTASDIEALKQHRKSVKRGRRRAA